MANKLVYPKPAGAGSASHPTKTHGIPFFRNVVLRTPGATTRTLTEGQLFPRKT